FKDPLDKIILEGLTGIIKVEQLQPGRFKLQTGNPELVRKQLMEIALQQNLNIVSLQSENQSLEHIFKSLTN
ncbi:MAG: gliding motility-associated ABC transporter ATP-binding subunit GldA, partial [Chitinophagaceae bacterium]